MNERSEYERRDSKKPPGVREQQSLLCYEMNKTTSQPVLAVLKNYPSVKIIQFGRSKYTDHYADVIVEDDPHNPDKSLESSLVEDPYNSALFLANNRWGTRVKLLHKWKDTARFIIIPGCDWFDKNSIDLQSMFTYKQTYVPRTKWSAEGPPTFIGSNIVRVPSMPHPPREGYIFRPNPYYGWGNIIRDWYAAWINHGKTHMILDNKFSGIFNTTLNDQLLFDAYDVAYNFKLQGQAQRFVTDDKYLDEFIAHLKQYITCDCETEKGDYIGVHIRFGDKYTTFKDPYIRIEDTEENKKRINDVIDQIKTEHNLPIKVVSDHPDYDGLHDTRNIRKKELDDFFLLMNAKKVYTFRTLNKEPGATLYSAFSVAASLFGKNELYIVDLEPEKPTIRKNIDKNLLYAF